MSARDVLSEPFEVLAADIVGPFPKATNGYMFLLTCLCTASRWPEAVPLKTVSAKVVAQGLVDVFSRTGIPLVLLTDQGSQFVGKVTATLCESFGVDKLKTSPYRPQTNGQIQHMHRTL